MIIHLELKCLSFFLYFTVLHMEKLNMCLLKYVMDNSCALDLKPKPNKKPNKKTQPQNPPKSSGLFSPWVSLRKKRVLWNQQVLPKQFCIPCFYKNVETVGLQLLQNSHLAHVSQNSFTVHCRCLLMWRNVNLWPSSKKAGIHIVLIDLGDADCLAYPCLWLPL